MGITLNFKSNSTTTIKVKLYLKNMYKPVKLTVDEIKTEEDVISYKIGEGTNDYSFGIFPSEEVIGAVV
ncbi:MAG: hypothetical protein OXF46_06630, partial [Rhodobacteraceae bacterium]|nr:hypothetical protein [Paracoccaceae bacterium]